MKKYLLIIVSFWIIYSVDSIAQWSLQIDVGTENLRDLYFIDANTGWIVGDWYVRQTTNGGANWVTKASQGGYCIYFIDQNIGFVGSNSTGLYRTTNGGTSWSLVYSTTSYFQDIQFVNDNVGWAVGGVSSTKTIIKTTDGGLNWVTQSIGLNGQYPWAASFVDENIGFVAYWGDDGYIYKTTDGGTNWVQNYFSTTGGYRSIHFIDSNHGWCVGTNEVLKTINGGNSWTTQTPVHFSSSIYKLECVQFLNQNTGYICGNAGVILKTTDSGTHWFGQNFDGELGASQIFFLDENDGWGVSAGGIVLHTSNGGGIPQLMVNYPNGGEVLQAGQPTQISWISNGINYINIRYTTNNGSTWEPIEYGVDASVGHYNWNVPNSEISSVKILIQNSANTSILDYGDSYFSISLGPTNSLTGYVTDATTGLGIEGAIVSVAGLNTTTLANGYYIINNVPPGTLTAEFNGYPLSGTAPLNVQFTDQSTDNTQTVTASMTGYSTYTNNQVVINPTGVTTLDISLSPALAEGEMRLVLNWGIAPTDLDSHLKTPLIEGNYYHIFYNDPGNESTPPYAILDHDDVTSYGPETITIFNFYTGTYYYYVHNYSGEHPINSSNGVVQIYNSAGLINTVQSPTTGNGLYWHVCNIDGMSKAITIINQIVTNPPGPVLLSDLSVNNIKKDIELKTYSEADNPESITSWLWDFGDGNTSALQHPAHIYQQAGNYTVSLTVDNGTTQITESKTNYITATANQTSALNILGPDTWFNGQEIELQIQIQDVTNLIVVSFDLLYPTQYVDYVSYTQGSFLPSCVVIPDDPGGKVSISEYNTAGSASGTGILITLKFLLDQNTPNNTPLLFNFLNVEANDASGNPIPLTLGTKTINSITGVSVWPGDANNSGGVTITDINPIIIYFGSTGPTRSVQGITWSPQLCEPWTPVAKTYSDCNGNGTIGITDINAVVVNFNKTYTFSLPASNEGKNISVINKSTFSGDAIPPLTGTSPSFMAPGEEYWVEVSVGNAIDPVTDMTVISIELLYDNTDKIDYVSFELGGFLSGANTTVIPDDANGKISASAYTFSGSGYSGYGLIFRFKFVVKTSNPPGPQVQINNSWGEVSANRSDGSDQPLDPIPFFYYVLPVELTSFTAKASNDQIKLNWETKTEVNNYGFEIERSSFINNESKTFQKIGFVQGNGNSNSPKHYQFTDNNPTGGSKFVYRLKQIDTDGAYEYSTEVEVELLPTEYVLSQNYPNPFNPVTNIKFSLPEQTQLKINLYNMLGELVATIAQGTYDSGYHMVTLNANNLPSGTYIYRLESCDFVQVKKLLLLK